MSRDKKIQQKIDACNIVLQNLYRMCYAYVNIKLQFLEWLQKP